MQDGKSWIEVSGRALEQNLRALGDVLRANSSPDHDPALLAVIKANGYGHGAALCAPVVARAGAEWLGVTDAAEGAAVRSALRDSGLAPESQPQILVMCGMERGDAPLIVEYGLTPAVWFTDQVQWLAARASEARPTAVHVEIDTGMARQGVRPGDELSRLLECVRAEPKLRLDGVMTHFAASEIAGSPVTHTQQERFEQALAQMRSAGLAPVWMHAGNTSTLDEARLLPWLRGQAASLGSQLLARSGLALYGYALPLEGAAGVVTPQLEPAAAWKTRIIALRAIAAGETVGYNATFTASAPMQLALLPVGYADGLRRELSATNDQAGGWVMVRGRRAPIVGRISMNLTTVDVSGIPAAALGDEVTLLGEGVTADDHARLAGTIPYEILCAMRGSRRLVA